MPARPRSALPLAALGLLPLGALVLRFDWLCDDSFIAFRYGRNLARGLGLRFNPGVEPPVEGYTQLGWVLWTALGQYFGLDVTIWSRLTTVGCAAALLIGLVLLVRVRLGLSVGASVSAAAFVSLFPPFAVWSTGGLGTMAFALVLWAFFERLLGDERRPRGRQAGFLAVLACVLRADAPWFLAAILLPALAAGRRRHPALWRSALSSAVLIAVSVAALTAWRIGYHGDWLPNTVRVKLGLSPLMAERGSFYLISFWLTFPAALVVPLLTAKAAIADGRPLFAASLAFVGATFVYCVLVSGDFMCMGRFLVPAVPHLALLLALWVERQGDRQPGGMVHFGSTRSRIALTAALLVAGSSLLPAWNLHLTSRSLRSRFHFRWNAPAYVSELEQWRHMVTRVRQWSLLGRALALHTRPGESLVATTIGAKGFYSDLYLYDRNGLVSREVAVAPPPPRRRRSPGHDRLVPATFFLDQEPTYLDARIGKASDAQGLLPHRRVGAGGEPEDVIPLSEDQGFAPHSVLVLVRPP